MKKHTTIRERFKRFLFDDFDFPPNNGTHRWIFCADTPEQVKNNDIYDCACCLNDESYSDECNCVCHPRIKQIADFFISNLLSDLEEVITDINKEERRFLEKEESHRNEDYIDGINHGLGRAQNIIKLLQDKMK